MGETPTAGISAHDLEIQTKVLQLFDNENMSIERDKSAHEYFMLARPTQSYILRCLIDYINPEGAIVTKTTTIDSASSLTLAVEALLHNLRKKDLGSVRGFAGSMRLKTA